MAIVVRKLRPEDVRSTFSSGNIELDRFFHRYAGQNQFRHHIGTTYVAVDGEEILGFATVAPTELAANVLSEGLRRRVPKYPLPALRLARLAVNERARGRGIGGELLRAVFVLAWRMADELGCVGVVVDAKPEAVDFYAKLGFIAVEVVAGELGDRPAPQVMFIELGAVPRP